MPEWDGKGEKRRAWGKVQGSNLIALVVFIVNFKERYSPRASASIWQNICTAHHCWWILFLSINKSMADRMKRRSVLFLFYQTFHILKNLFFLSSFFIPLQISFHVLQESHTAKKYSSSTCLPSKTQNSSSLHLFTTSTSGTANTNDHGNSEGPATRPVASSIPVLPPHSSSSMDHPQTQPLQHRWET